MMHSPPEATPNRYMPQRISAPRFADRENKMPRNAGVVVAYNGGDAGLGNRMRVTLGASRYAAHRGLPFLYVWPSTPQFEPQLTELWEWSSGVKLPRALSRAAGRITGYEGHDLRELGSRRIIQIRTGAELILPDGAGDWRDDLRALVPVPEIADVVTTLHREQFGNEPYVGVQLRVHDVSHAKTKDTSPVDWFTDRMRLLLAERPETRFYISCDVLEVKEQILRDFPTASAHVVSARYNSTAAVRAAIVDLYLLASSSYMLGPHFSSFIEMAQFLADMKVPTDKPEERPKDVQRWWELPPVTDPLAPSARR